MSFVSGPKFRTMATLKLFLRINALFSGGSGLLLILFHGPLARLFEVPMQSPFWIIGIGLLLFAALVGLASTQERTRIPLIKSIILMDLLWVLGSSGILIASPFGISGSGHLLIGVVALIVLSLALGQASGTKRYCSMG